MNFHRFAKVVLLSLSLCVALGSARADGEGDRKEAARIEKSIPTFGSEMTGSTIGFGGVVVIQHDGFRVTFGRGGCGSSGHFDPTSDGKSPADILRTLNDEPNTGF